MSRLHRRRPYQHPLYGFVNSAFALGLTLQYESCDLCIDGVAAEQHRGFVTVVTAAAVLAKWRTKTHKDTDNFLSL
jgi:hypothetical protein